MSELKTGSFYFGDDKNAAKRFAKHCKVNGVRYAYRNTDTGTVIDVLADDSCMFCLTEGYRIITESRPSRKAEQADFKAMQQASGGRVVVCTIPDPAVVTEVNDTIAEEAERGSIM